MDTLISINLLEFLVEIINYAATTVLFQKNLGLYNHGHPILLNWIDNQTSKAWIKKSGTKLNKGKALICILCSLMINNLVGIKSEHIAGADFF